MKRFIGYFDLMGYKQFIINNSTAETKRRLGHVLRDIENSLGRGKLKDTPHGFVADLSHSTIKSISISDTIIFWTQDDSNESLEEFLDSCFRLNWTLNTYNFPVRGVMIYDEMEMIRGADENASGGLYSVNTIYGMGLINAHLKSDDQNWAGTCVDISLTTEIHVRNLLPMLDHFAIKTIVPYKTPQQDQQQEYALRLVTGNFNEMSFNNVKDNIVRIFAADNKPMNARANEMLQNTINFLAELKTLD